MQKRIITLMLTVLTAALLTGCKHPEETDFAGTVIGSRECTAAYPQISYGYLVSLEYPAGIGTDMPTSSGDTARNVIVMYEPTVKIRVSDHIHGTFYLDDKYSKAYCSWQWDGEKLHEGVFMRTVIDR